MSEHDPGARMWPWVSLLILGGVLLPLFLVGHHSHRLDVLRSGGVRAAGPGAPRLASFTSRRSPFLVTTPAEPSPRGSFFWGIHFRNQYTCGDHPHAYLLDGRGVIHSKEEFEPYTPTATAQFSVDGHSVEVEGDEVRMDGRLLAPLAPGEPIEVDLDALPR